MKDPVSLSRAIDLLTEAGVSVLARDADTVDLDLHPGRVQAKIRVRQTSPSKWDIRQELPRAPEYMKGAGSGQRIVSLYVVARASDNLRQMAHTDPRVAVVSLTDRLAIIDGNKLQPDEPDNDMARGAAVIRGRVGWGRLAVMRVLLRTREPRRQAELAQEAGITQAAISQMLSRFGTDITRTGTGWAASEPERMWNMFMSEYPGPQGIRTSWYGLNPVTEQADTIRTAVNDERKSTDALLISGDVAADQIAARRIPTRAIVYSGFGIDLAQYGFAASSRGTATLDYVVPADQTVWATARAWAGNTPASTVDPVLAAWDVAQTGGPDAGEAVMKLRQGVLRAWTA